jgi:hypothetical protein
MKQDSVEKDSVKPPPKKRVSVNEPHNRSSVQEETEFGFADADGEYAKYTLWKFEMWCFLLDGALHPAWIPMYSTYNEASFINPIAPQFMNLLVVCINWSFSLFKILVLLSFSRTYHSSSLCGN